MGLSTSTVPLNMLGTFHYRYCRNGQCAARMIQPRRAHPQRAMNSRRVSRLRMFRTRSARGLAGTQIRRRWSARRSRRVQPGFVGGIEFQPDYRPDWSYYYPQALQTAQGLGTNWVFHDSHLDIFQQQSFYIFADPRPDPLMDRFSSHGQPRPRAHEILNVGIFPSHTLPRMRIPFGSLRRTMRIGLEQLVHCISSLCQ